MYYSKLFQSRILEISVGVGTVAIVTLALTFRAFRKPKKITRIIDTMEALNKPTVHIKNRDNVEELVSQLIKGGAGKLQVISDFDFTISRVHLNGIRCSSTYGILDNSPYTNEEYKLKKNRLLNHYHPIEVDPSLTRDQKTPFMVEWYSKNIDLMPISGVTKSLVTKMVAESSVNLRDGADQMFQTLYQHNVPLLVFSAGIGDLLKEVLRQRKLLFPNIEVIANFFCYDEHDKLSGFEGDVIHTFNKSASTFSHLDHFEKVKHRNNIILMGDSLGDLTMAEGIEDVNTILKIGFLNFKVDQSLPDYLEAYDIVLTDDQTMDVVIGLLQSIL